VFDELANIGVEVAGGRRVVGAIRFVIRLAIAVSRNIPWPFSAAIAPS
jgi:hypothetical protein